MLSEKAARDLWDPNPVEALHVHGMMMQNFPGEALDWVLRTRWIGPMAVPWERIDRDDQEKWAASHQPGKVASFRKMIANGEGVHPCVLVQPPDSDRAVIVDGHHRAMAWAQCGKPVRGYVGFVRRGDVQAALETHSSQMHSGSSPSNR
jgi:hypothetical protein